MHARAAEPPPGVRKPGCHRAPAAPSNVVCLRSACGHDALTETPVALKAMLAEQGGILVASAGVRLRGDDPRRPTRTAPQPPTEPPRVVPA